MAAKLQKDLKDERIMRYARLTKNMSGAGAYSEQEYDTQLSIERGVIWLIHNIEFEATLNASMVEVAASGFEELEMHIARETKTGVITIENVDCIQHFKREIYRSAAIGTDAGPLWYTSDWPVKFDFPLPIPYASQNIYLGVDGTLAGLIFASARIGYTIVQVSDKYFFRVAQALLG